MMTEYPKSMFLSRNKKNNVYHCKPQFYYRKVGFKGFNIIYMCRYVFMMIYRKIPLLALREHAYSNILKILQPKKGFFYI